MAAPAVLRSSLHVLEPLDRLRDSFSAVVTVVSALESSPEGLCDRLRGSETWVNFGSMTTTLGSVNWPKNCCNDRPNAANGLSSGVSIFRACVMHTQKACSETYELIHTDVQTEKTLIHPIRTKPNNNTTQRTEQHCLTVTQIHTPQRARARTAILLPKRWPRPSAHERGRPRRLLLRPPIMANEAFTTDARDSLSNTRHEAPESIVPVSKYRRQKPLPAPLQAPSGAAARRGENRNVPR